MPDTDTGVFTVRFPQVVGQIRLNIGITAANRPDDPSGIGRRFLAIWDTGSNKTVISPRVALSLQLESIGTSNLEDARGKGKTNKHLVNLFLPNGIMLPEVTVGVVVNDLLKADALIGMDVISLGDSSISTHGAKTVLSFRYPALGGVDYQKERSG